MNSPTATGRPRDPGVDARIARAASDLYGEVGWSGFSMEAVARRAGVGKASLYLRWQDKEQLLSDALSSQIVDIADVDTGTLRGDLIQLARQLLRHYTGEHRHSLARMSVEAPSIPGTSERWTQFNTPQVMAARALVNRGVDRGEISKETSTTLLLDTLCGGVSMHVASTPPHLREQMAAGIDDYAERIVDFLLAAVTADLAIGR